MDLKPDISIIMPVYNAEKELQQSMDSFFCQTLQSIELIVVNDASTDGSARLLDEFSRKDKRVRVFHCENNRGPNSARKIAVAQARGDYIMFLDSDDALMPDACTLALSLIRESGTDILHFGSEIAFKDSILPPRPELIADKSQTVTPAEHSRIEKLRSVLLPYPGQLTEDQILRGCFEQERFNFVLWNKIFRREPCQKGFSLCPDIPIYLAEDLLAFFFVAYHSETYLGKPKAILYRYTYGEGISTRHEITMARIRHLSGAMNVPKYILRYLEEKGRVPAFYRLYEAIFTRQSDALLFNLSEYLHQMNPDQGGQAIDVVLAALPARNLAEFMAEHFFHQPGIYFRALRHSSLGKRINRQIKTVGTFYHRLRQGGVERVISQLIPLWHRMGLKIVLFTDEPEDERDYAIEVPYIRVILPRCDVLNGGKDYPPRARAFEKALCDNHVDTMIYHAWTSPYLPWDLLVCRVAGCAFCIHTHSTIDSFMHGDVVSQSFYAQMPFIYGVADGVLALSEMDTAFWQCSARWAIQVINPLPDAYNISRESRKLCRTVLWVGRLSPEKNPEDAILIFENVLQEIPNAKLHVVGTGENNEQSRLHAMAKERKLEGQAVFMGHLMDVGPAYENADVLLVTSSYEGFPLAVAEAQARGLPVVMYELPYLSLVQDRMGVLSVEHRSIKEAANALLALMKDAKLYARMSSDAMANIERFRNVDHRLSWQQIFRKLEAQEDSLSESKQLNRYASLHHWYRFIEGHLALLGELDSRVRLSIDAHLASMTVRDSAVLMLKNIARRVLGKEYSDRIHDWRVRRSAITKHRDRKTSERKDPQSAQDTPND